MGGAVHQYVLKRLLLFIPTIILVTLLVFVLMRTIPGDPALLLLAGSTGRGEFTDEQLENLRHELGTDRTLPVQYGEWMWGLLRGDMGKSMVFRGVSVQEKLGPRIPLTLELAVMAAIISFLIAVPLGMLSAVKQDTILDYGARIFSFTGISVPVFVTGIVVIYLLVQVFGYFPPLGYASPWEDPWKNLQQLIFPALTIALFQTNFTARVTRSALLEVMREDYIRTARSKGLREQNVLFLHVLKNAFLPIITVSGWGFGLLLGGSIIVEKIFVIPGMGTLLLESVNSRDYNLIQSIVLVYAVSFLAVNFLVDLVYGWLDPRIRYA